jgi:GxxExxY protein
MREAHDLLTESVIGAAIYVHQMLGPGLLESTYEECVTWALTKRRLQLRRQVDLPVVFEGHRVNAAYRIDIVVEQMLILEIKTVERILPVHEAQLRTYLRLSGIKTGLLLNFLVPVMKDGIRRMSV